MDRGEKEKHVISVRLEEVKSLDRDMTSLAFKFMGVWGAVFILFWNIHLLGNKYVIGALIGSGIGILWSIEQYSKYVVDCYDWLALSIRDDKILQESMPIMKRMGSLYYKRKYTGS